MSDYGRGESLPLFDQEDAAPKADRLPEVAESRAKVLGFATATRDDLLKLTEQKREILSLLRDAWVTGRDLILQTGASEATRRVRELRSEGFDIRKRGGGREVAYHWSGKVVR